MIKLILLILISPIIGNAVLLQTTIPIEYYLSIIEHQLT